jgi:thiol:disulfide interchange protein DsbA
MTRLSRFTACVLFAFAATATAQHDHDTPGTRSFEESFQEIKPAQPTGAEGKIEVIEIFWYGCPHCYSFEPYLDKWMATKPADVEFVRMPGVLNPSWVQHARAFYTAQKLGVLDKIHMPLFQAIHRDRERIFSEDELRAFFTAQGVDGNDFDRVYRSNEIDTRMKQALFRARGARVTGVPTIVVNGRYMTSGTMTGSFERMLEVTDQLIALERERIGVALPAVTPAEPEPAAAVPAQVSVSEPPAASAVPEPVPPAAEVAPAGVGPVSSVPADTAQADAPATTPDKPPYLIILGVLAAVIVATVVLKGRRQKG